VEAKGQVRSSDRVSDPGLRVESAAVTLRRLGVDAWINRVALAAVWIGGIATFHWLDILCACWMPILMLGATAVIVGRRHGAAIVGVRSRGEPGALIAGADGIEVVVGRKRTRFARGELAAGWMETYGNVEEVVLCTRSSTLVRAAVESRERGLELLRAAGVAPEQRAVSIRLGVTQTSGGRAALIFLATLFAPVALALAVGFVASFAVLLDRPGDAFVCVVYGVLTAIGIGVEWLLVRPLVTTTIEIGTDGVILKRLFRRRFVSRAALVAAEAHGDHVVIRRTEGVPWSVETSGNAEASVVAARIREATADRGYPGAEDVTLERLDRRGRSADDWLRDLRALGGERSGYREARLDRRELLDLVENGAAPPERRIAAAAVLSVDPEAKQRARIAAEACAEPRLRVALEKASRGEIDEDEVEGAIGAAQQGAAAR
jgi:hypothetical protein